MVRKLELSQFRRLLSCVLYGSILKLFLHRTWISGSNAILIHMHTLRNFFCGPLSVKRDFLFIKVILFVEWTLNALDFEGAGKQGRDT